MLHFLSALKFFGIRSIIHGMSPTVSHQFSSYKIIRLERLIRGDEYIFFGKHNKRISHRHLWTCTSKKALNIAQKFTMSKRLGLLVILHFLKGVFLIKMRFSLVLKKKDYRIIKKKHEKL